MIDTRILYPIGSIYMSITNVNPSDLFGGTWQRIAKGRTLVGVDENDSDFASAELELGEKKHTLTIDEMPSHNHGGRTIYPFSPGGNFTGLPNSSSSSYHSVDGASILNTGGGQSHNNLQPSFTCYIWCRTA